jgi:hypothetical protein
MNSFHQAIAVSLILTGIAGAADIYKTNIYTKQKDNVGVVSDADKVRYEAAHSLITSHVADKLNPHATTAAQTGAASTQRLDNFSAVTQSKLNEKLNKSSFDTYTGKDRVAYADSVPLMVSHGGAMAMVASHPGSIQPYGSHPAAGANKQEQYNNAGTPAGAAYSRYSAGTKINQAASRYGHSQEWHGEQNELVAFVLGHGTLVIGQHDTSAFTGSWNVPPGSSVSFASDTGYITFTTTHSIDDTTAIKGASIIFVNFTSFNVTNNSKTFIPRRSVTTGTNVRIKYTTAIKNIYGTAIQQSYSGNWNAL